MIPVEHVFCGQAWTTDELIDAGFDHYVFNEAGVAQIPHLPGAWPLCPMCASPLHRLRAAGDHRNGGSQAWACEPKRAREIEAAQALEVQQP